MPRPKQTTRERNAMLMRYGRRGKPISFHAALLVDQITQRVSDDSVNRRAKQDLFAYYAVIEETLALNPVTIAGARALIQTYKEEGSTKRITGSLWYAYDDACRRFLHAQGDPKQRMDFIQAGFRLR